MNLFEKVPPTYKKAVEWDKRGENLKKERSRYPIHRVSLFKKVDKHV